MKAVITCGGLGTRLYPFTKEIPKEMAPVFYRTENTIQMCPLIQVIFQNLYANGIRDYCFVTGKTKRAIENHFTVDSGRANEHGLASQILDSRIFWITQNQPKGFGDAAIYAKEFARNDKFLLHAGDVAMIQKKENILRKMMEASESFDAILCVRKVSEPKRHGIVEVDSSGYATRVEEKPDNPKTDLGIRPIYIFGSSIFKCIENTEPGKNNEIQLTDAIQRLIEHNEKIKVLRVDEEIFWDVGTPESYWEALNSSYTYRGYA